jgi:HK97 family phage major capsid protein
MNEEEFKALVAKIELSIGTTMDEKLKVAFKALDPKVLKAISDSAELKKVVDGLSDKNQKLIDAQKEQSTLIEELQIELKKKGAEKAVSLKSEVKRLLTENKVALAAMKDTNTKENLRMVSKAVADMMVSTNVATGVIQAEREAGITRIVRRNPFIIELVNVGTINSNLWEWVQQANPEGDAAMTAEGAKKAQVDFDLVLASAQVRKVTAFIKVSKEMLDDVDLIESEIDQELTELINLKIDTQVLSGDGTGQNLTGIMGNATAFAPGSFATGSANEVTTPTKQDVLRVVINQIDVALFAPNYIVMHPTDVTSMDLQKATDGHYILPPFSTAANTVIKSIPVVANTGVTEGTYLVGDFTKSGVRFKEGLTFDVGYENDDFTKNFVTILAEARLVHRVKSNHYAAFVKGTFVTDAAAIAKA